MAGYRPPPDYGSDRYVMQAWVCGGTCVRRLVAQGSVTFNWIFQNRPKDCRYAVTSQYDVTLADYRYLVFDLYEVKLMPPEGTPVTPRPRFVHADLDAAIMGTVLLYSNE